MALSKDTVLDRIEIVEDGTIQVRRAVYILEDGVRVTDARYARVVFTPGSDMTGQPLVIQRVANAVWTPAVIAAYQAKVAAAAAAIQ